MDAKASAEWNDWVFAEVMRGVGFWLLMIIHIICLTLLGDQLRVWKGTTYIIR
jgi:hypothetical protein